MYSRKIIWGAVLGLMIFASACTSTRYYTSSEYDDVYYNASDESNLDNPVVNTENTEAGNGVTYSGAPTYTSPDSRGNNSYNDHYYADDDFHFSRRIRRFNNVGTGFRYYDPFYTNDLYFVIGTSSWNRWNQRGWYSWNNPRFGVSWGYNPGWDPFLYQGFYNPYVYNPWNTVNYYNPWVVSYYGYAPTYGYGGFGGWGNAGWGGGRGYAYCPPSYYRNGTFNNNNNTGLNTGNYNRYRQAHRSSPGMVASRPGSTTRTSGVRDRVKPRTGAPTTSTATTPVRTRNVGGIDYLRPSTSRTSTVRTNRTPSTPSVNNPRTAPRSNPRVYTAPNNQPQREATPATRTPSRQPRVAPAPTRTPRQTPSRNNNVRQNRNSGTSPSVSPRRSPRVNPSSTPRVSPSRTPRVSPSRNNTPSRTVKPQRSTTPSRRSTGGNNSGTRTRIKRN